MYPIIDEVMNRVKGCVGYVESDHKEEVIKGAQMACTLMYENIEKLQNILENQTETTEYFRSQLQTISSIILQHSDK